MKKVWKVLVLLCALLFCLAACGKKEAESSSVDLIVEDSGSSVEASAQDEDDIPSYTTSKAESPAPAPAPAPASESKSSPSPHPASTPATAGLPLLPLLGAGLAVSLFLLLREMRKKY